eukprot:353449-Rhodomonas_salina.2
MESLLLSSRVKYEQDALEKVRGEMVHLMDKLHSSDMSKSSSAAAEPTISSQLLMNRYSGIHDVNSFRLLEDSRPDLPVEPTAHSLHVSAVVGKSTAEQEEEMRLLHERTQSLQTELHRMAAEMRERDQDLLQLRTGMNERDQDLTQLREEIIERDLEFPQLRAEMSERDQQFAQFRAEMRERDEDVIQLREALDR